MNYFELYNLPVSFIVDAMDVRKRFIELSKQFHPDYFTLENSEKQQEILDISTINNKAFQTLSLYTSPCPRDLSTGRIPSAADKIE